jgi:hypothetical protein
MTESDKNVALLMPVLVDTIPVIDFMHNTGSISCMPIFRKFRSFYGANQQKQDLIDQAGAATPSFPL